MNERRYTEDDVCTRLIENEVENLGSERVTASPEAHYNHYGTRGVADLYIACEWQDNELSEELYEIKSASAIENATGANEILRQFKRMAKYFYQDESNRKAANHYRYSTRNITLALTPDRECAKHIDENITLYKAAVDRITEELDYESVTVSFVCPDTGQHHPVVGNHLSDSYPRKHLFVRGGYMPTLPEPALSYLEEKYPERSAEAEEWYGEVTQDA